MKRAGLVCYKTLRHGHSHTTIQGDEADVRTLAQHILTNEPGSLIIEDVLDRRTGQNRVVISHPVPHAD
jgi:hypothetical protein